MKYADIMVLILVLLVLATLIYIIFLIKTEGFLCINDTLSFIQNKTGATCSCWKYNLPTP